MSKAAKAVKCSGAFSGVRWTPRQLQTFSQSFGDFAERDSFLLHRVVHGHARPCPLDSQPVQVRDIRQRGGGPAVRAVANMYRNALSRAICSRKVTSPCLRVSCTWGRRDFDAQWPTVMGNLAHLDAPDENNPA